MKCGPGILFSILFEYVFIIGSCNFADSGSREFKDLMSSVTKIEIRCYENGDSISQTVTTKNGLDIFKEIINGKNENVSKGKVLGRIVYFRDDTEIFSADKITEGIEYSYKSNIYKSKITYRAGRFFEETCYDLSNKKN